jgi:hypothetical protein
MLVCTLTNTTTTCGAAPCRCVYMGRGGEASVAAFAKAGLECPLHWNPPDYFMRLATDGTFANAEVRARLEGLHDAERDTALSAHADVATSLVVTTKQRYAASYTTQLKVLGTRSWRREKATRLTFDSWLLYGSLAAITGLNWVGMGGDEADVPLRNGLTLWMIGTWMFFPLIASLTVLSPERPLVLKELAAGSYRLSAYYVTKVGVHDRLLSSLS